MGRVKIMAMMWLIFGAIILAFFLIIDVIGLGSTGFGPRQISGIIVGAVLIAFGLIRLLLAKRKTTSTES